VKETRAAFIRAGLEGLYLSGIHRLARHLVSGAGAILTFHRVRPASDGAFQPNRTLEITPAFLDELITSLSASDIDIVSMDEVYERLVAGGEASRRRFVALTFDDGYRDNRSYALPVLQRHDVPFALYVVPDYADGFGRMWWVTLEGAIEHNESIEIAIGGERRVFDCSTTAAKDAAFGTLYEHIRTMPTHAESRAFVARLAEAAGVDPEEDCRALVMNWRELRSLAEDPRVTIGAHTMSHPILTQLDDDSAFAEISGSREALAAKLDRAVDHFAYPVGQPYAAGPREFALAREAGFKTAVTTRAGVLFPAHADHLTALPRISVNGAFQSLHYIDVLLSGAPTLLKNGFRRVDAA
jgi:peptidoglycan/xylan/chitin deacetylase (PgdA/CDA1 family)